MPQLEALTKQMSKMNGYFFFKNTCVSMNQYHTLCRQCHCLRNLDEDKGMDYNNATQIWKTYVCQVSASGICTTTGRLTPSLYNQIVVAFNLSYGLYNYGPFLVDLQDCGKHSSTYIGITVLIYDTTVGTSTLGW
ncbi:hypothetical protein LWI29_021473 [Acer saccharum]|uniref:Uncharacterized protein n=1 Tax=Acer saccharum TaxID=4024 RepID=A0AA39V9V2_ACESA|nr:hypothetical protein LWI29_021473 [Acer saccharum]